jgi:hypothetical protein
MDKFHYWVVSSDVTWAKTIGLFGLMTLKSTPIRHPIVKEFLYSIVWLNVNAIEFVV